VCRVGVCLSLPPILNEDCVSVCVEMIVVVVAASS
jgi:hypothetical protein